MAEQKASYQIGNKKVQLEKVIDLKKDIWNSGKVTIISLTGLQKIAQKENIVEKDFRTEITPMLDNKQQTVVSIWLGLKGDNDKDNWVRGSGEASMLNTGKIVSTPKGNKYEEYNEVDSCYRFAMAEKRAFSRALLKMVSLYGVYCEVDSSDFKKEDDKEETDFNY